MNVSQVIAQAALEHPEVMLLAPSLVLVSVSSGYSAHFDMNTRCAMRRVFFKVACTLPAFHNINDRARNKMRRHIGQMCLCSCAFHNFPLGLVKRLFELEPRMAIPALSTAIILPPERMLMRSVANALCPAFWADGSRLANKFSQWRLRHLHGRIAHD